MHSTKAGKRTIKLPRPATVTNAITQEKIGENLTEITVEIDPPATFIFSLE